MAADLPGLRRLVPPAASAEDHAPHAKRALAADLVAAMARARPRRASPSPATTAAAASPTGWRSTTPAVVTRLAVLDIVPTGEIWARADAAFALGYWHWAFLAQPAPLPERLILGDPDGVLARGRADGHQARRPALPRRGRRRLPRAARRPRRSSTAMCEDYRAGATIDRALDDADRGRRTIACPVRALWGGAGALPRFYEDPLELVARRRARTSPGRAVEGASHFLVEDAPEEVAADLGGFFGER